MAQFTISIERAAVLREVRKTSEYIGQKHRGSDGRLLYERLSATIDNEEMLERFWSEACSSLSIVGSERIVAATTGGDFGITFNLTDHFNAALRDSMEQDMFSYMVNSIVFKWLLVCGFPDMASNYSSLADSILTMVRYKIHITTGNTHECPTDIVGGATFGEDESGGGDDEELESGLNTIGESESSVSGDDGMELESGLNTIGESESNVSGDDGMELESGLNTIGESESSVSGDDGMELESGLNTIGESESNVSGDDGMELESGLNTIGESESNVSGDDGMELESGQNAIGESEADIEAAESAAEFGVSQIGDDEPEADSSDTEIEAEAFCVGDILPQQLLQKSYTFKVS